MDNQQITDDTSPPPIATTLTQPNYTTLFTTLIKQCDYIGLTELINQYTADTSIHGDDNQHPILNRAHDDFLQINDMQSNNCTIFGLACRFLSGDDGLSIIKQLFEAKADIAGRYMQNIEDNETYNDVNYNATFTDYITPITCAYSNAQFDPQIVDYLIQQGELLTNAPISNNTTNTPNSNQC